MGVGGWAEHLALPGRSERDLLTRFWGGEGRGCTEQGVSIQLRTEVHWPSLQGAQLRRNQSRREMGGRRWGTKLDGSSRQLPTEAGVRGTLLSDNRSKFLPACFSIAPTALTMHHFKQGGSWRKELWFKHEKKCHFASEQTAFLCLGSFCVAWI